MSVSDKSSKTEKPTPKRKKDARKKGQIARSQEVSAWGSVLVGTFLIQYTIKSGGQVMHDLMNQTAAAASRPDPNTAVELLGHGLGDVARIVAPLAIGIMFVGIVSNFAQVGFAVSGSRLKPKWERLNPAAGIKRLVSPAS